MALRGLWRRLSPPGGLQGDRQEPFFEGMMKHRRRRSIRLACGTILAAGVMLCAAWVGFGADHGEPRFTDANELLRPQGYREWVFVGASLGMSYDENGAVQKDPKFHNVYLHPRAHRHFKQTGRFPEGTILAMEVLTAGSQASINRQGHFEDRLVGVEAAVKDSSRFPEGWAYFSFTGPNGALTPTAKAFPKERCWACHREHADTDNVFSQFYPVLREQR